MTLPIQSAPKRLIGKRVVRHRLGDISDTTLWRRVKCGVIPKPIRLANGLSMWTDDEIDAVITNAAENRVR
jgi:predicted DNA-binding transcriptional regulator AlpA